ncbi:MAG: DUF1284 domain-containing protein [Phycisphaerae bacterium]
MMRLRPHHLIDIVTSFGQGRQFSPHPYGHALHTVAREVLANPDIEVEFIIGADDICQPCSHLTPDGRCDDILTRFDPPISKQDYNDALDRRVFKHMGMAPGNKMTVRQFLERVASRLPGLMDAFTSDKKIWQSRLEGLTNALRLLGIGQRRKE